MAADWQTPLRELKQRRPLVHAISGAVTAPFITDVLGALGARAAVTHDPAEAGTLAMQADALLVNLGQPDPLRLAGGREAARAARIAGTPWVLDPVLVHASARRREQVRTLLSFRPAVLKPNRAELAALAAPAAQGASAAQAEPEAQATTHGATDANAAADALATSLGLVVLASGEQDIISDGTRREVVTGGHPFMDALSGFGCALGAATAALLTVAEPLEAAHTAAHAFAEAGNRAASAMQGPGSFRIAFLDALWQLGEEGAA